MFWISYIRDVPSFHRLKTYSMMSLSLSLLLLTLIIPVITAIRCLTSHSITKERCLPPSYCCVQCSTLIIFSQAKFASYCWQAKVFSTFISKSMSLTQSSCPFVKDNLWTEMFGTGKLAKDWESSSGWDENNAVEWKWWCSIYSDKTNFSPGCSSPLLKGSTPKTCYSLLFYAEDWRRRRAIEGQGIWRQFGKRSCRSIGL